MLQSTVLTTSLDLTNWYLFGQDYKPTQDINHLSVCFNTTYQTRYFGMCSRNKCKMIQGSHFGSYLCNYICVTYSLYYFKSRIPEVSLFLTGTGINVGQQFQVGPEPVEVGWVTSPLQCNCQLLDTLSKRCWGLQLWQRKRKRESMFGQVNG